MQRPSLPTERRRNRRAWLAAAAAVLAATGIALVLAPIAAPASSDGGVASRAAVAPAAGAAFALSAPGVSPTAISLSWTESTSVFFRNYTVFRSNVSASGPWQVADVVTSAATDVVAVAGLTPGATYWWNVTAYSGLLSATPSYSSVLAAAQPATATLTEPAHTSSSVSLTWTNNATYGGDIAFGFYRLVEIDDGVATVAANLSAPTDNATTVVGLDAGSSYSFYLETFDCDSGCGTGTPAYVDSVSNTIVAGTASALSVTILASRATTDVGLPDTFTCTPSGGTPPYALSWNFTNGTSAGAVGGGTVGHAFAEPSALGYRVMCEVTDHAGDVATEATTVTVDPAPSVRATAFPSSVEAGSSVSLRCAATPGTAPIAVEWVLGDGRSVNRSSAFANLTTSYAPSGSYLAECVATDAVGDRAVASVTIDVSGRPALPWISPVVVLFTSSAAGGGVAAGAETVSRRSGERDRSSALARWIPPAGPAGAVHGTKVCPSCGVSNVPLRRSCATCGTALPRAPRS